MFSDSCAICHGVSGGGGPAPRLIGAGNNLASYVTAQGLFDKIRTGMPLNAPGSLSQQAYLQVTAYILLQNNYVTSGTVLSNLAGISLVR